MALLEDTMRGIGELDAPAMRAARNRLDNLTMPHWALGRLCDLAVQLSGIRGDMPPPTARRTIVVMAGDHGVVAQGVSLHSQKVTGQMVANIIAGGAGVNVLARLNGAGVVTADFGMAERDEALVAAGKLVDCNIGKGTADMSRGPAMSREQARAAVEKGIALARKLAEGTDVFGTGEMGIANTTPATAIVACLTGKPVAGLCGPGTGLDDAGMVRKTAVIEKSIEHNRPDSGDGLDLLSKVGGFEIGGIAGLILGAAASRRPVFVDGFISSAGAMIAALLCPASRPYMILSHASAEPGHAAMCEWFGSKPLFDLGMRLGEGTGAAMAMNLAGAATAILTEMATFDGAGVDAKME